MKKVILIETEDNNIIYNPSKVIESDITVTDEDINKLATTELDEGNHDDFVEDYNTPLEFYTSNAEKDSYIGYIKDILDEQPISDDLAYEVQKLVIEEIKSRIEA